MAYPPPGPPGAGFGYPPGGGSSVSPFNYLFYILETVCVISFVLLLFFCNHTFKMICVSSISDL